MDVDNSLKHNPSSKGIKHQNSRIALAHIHDHNTSQNRGPKRVVYGKENILNGNKRIRRSESDGDSRSNSSRYSPWLNPVPLPPVSKGRKPPKSSSSTPAAEKEKIHVTKSVSSEMQCNSDRAWSGAEEGDIVFGAENSSFDVGYQETSILPKEAQVIKRLVHSNGTRMPLSQNRKLSQRISDNALWDYQQRLKSGAARGTEVQIEYDDEEEQRVTLLVHDAKPPYFDGRTVFTKQTELIFPKDPTSDMVKISRESSNFIHEVHEKQSMDKSRELAGSKLGNILGVEKSAKQIDADTSLADEHGEVDFKGDAKFAQHMKKGEAVSDFAKSKSLSEQRQYLPIFSVRDELLKPQERGYGGSIGRYVDAGPGHMSQPSKRIHGSQNGSCDRNSPPSGWLDCPPYGDAVKFIIPSKVPLRESFNDKIVTDKRYSPRQAILQQKCLGRELGLVIDLTNTNRYCWKSDWTKEGIEYVKIMCAGRDSVPDSKSVDKFIQTMTRFSSQHAHSNKYVLVHCTHGHNRTGYMIVQFLIRSESISLTEAINRFSEARPPGIYKQDYLDDLCNFFGEQLPRTFVCPQTPEWKRSPDRDDDVASGLQDNGFQASQKTNVVGKGDTINVVGAGEMANALGEDEMEHVKVPRGMTNDDKLGHAVPFSKMKSMRQFCNKVLDLNSWGTEVPIFPGSHPVSLSRDNLQLLRQQYYYATWKSDGTRYMLLITWDGCYLIDRKFDFRSVDLRFPCGNANEGAAGNTHNNTLLDGEMVIDTDPSTQRQERRYLTYDLITINGISLVDQPFSSRWRILEDEVINPRNKERDTLFKSSKPYYRYDMEPFRVRRKEFYLLSAVPKLLEKLIPSLSHASDGLIFQGWDDPYVSLTNNSLLKWKYPEKNSVDFLLEVGNNNRPMLYLNVRGKMILLDGRHGAFRDPSPSVDIFSLSGKIIECSWDYEENVWVFMRMRPDKSTPNAFSTYEMVMRSIKDNITEEDVINEIQEIIRLPMYAARIRADCETFKKNGRHK